MGGRRSNSVYLLPVNDTDFSGFVCVEVIHRWGDSPKINPTWANAGAGDADAAEASIDGEAARRDDRLRREVRQLTA